MMQGMENSGKMINFLKKISSFIFAKFNFLILTFRNFKNLNFKKPLKIILKKNSIPWIPPINRAPTLFSLSMKYP